jgi:hypothetical protein
MEPRDVILGLLLTRQQCQVSLWLLNVSVIFSVSCIDPVLRNLDTHLSTVAWHDRICSAKLSLTFLPQRTFYNSIVIISACSLVYLTFLPCLTVHQHAAHLTCMRKADWYHAYSNQQGNRVCLTNKFSRGLSTLTLYILHNGTVMNIENIVDQCVSVVLYDQVITGLYLSSCS